jgi:O-antigen/teichoic acid export membrane protein
MNTFQRVTKNTLVMIVANFTGKVFTFFYVMYIARYLGADGFGLLSFAIGFTGIFVVFTDLGLETLTVREVARDKNLAAKYLGNFVFVKIILAFLTFGLIAIVINLLDYSSLAIRVVYLMALHIIFRGFSSLNHSIIRANEKLEYISFSVIVGNFLMIVGVFAGVYFRFDVLGFSWVFVIVSAIDLLYSTIVCCLKFALPKFEIDQPFWLKSIKNAWPIGLMSIFILIYFRIDTVMLSLMKGDPHVGYYAAAYRLSEILTVIPAMFLQSIFPVLSSYFNSSKSSFKRTYELSAKYLFYLALPLALIGTLVAPKIIQLVYGQEFAPSVPALQILIWAAALMYVTTVQGTTLIAADRQMLNTKISALCVVLNIALNFIVIPKFSYVGASLSTVATELFGLIVTTLVLNRMGFKVRFIHSWLVPLVSLLVAIAFAVPLNLLKVNVFVIAAVSLIVYVLAISLIGRRDEDRKLLRLIFSGSQAS